MGVGWEKLIYAPLLQSQFALPAEHHHKVDLQEWRGGQQSVSRGDFDGWGAAAGVKGKAIHMETAGELRCVAPSSEISRRAGWRGIPEVAMAPHHIDR